MADFGNFMSNTTRCRMLAHLLAMAWLAIAESVLGLNPAGAAESRAATATVPAAVRNGGARLVGRLPASQWLHFDLTLSLSHPSELRSFLHQIYDPSSALYRRFVTPGQFTERFGPTQAQHDAVIAFANAHGFRLLGGSRDAMNLQFESSVQDIEAAFHVKMNRYQHPTENRTFYSPDTEPSVDVPLALWHISGLNDFAPPQPTDLHPGKRARLAVLGVTYDGFYTSSTLRTAYYGGSLSGSGQTLGLVQFTPFNPADVTLTLSNSGQTNSVSINAISVGGAAPTCTTNCSATQEVEPILDIVQSAAMAPGLGAINVCVGTTPSAVLAAISTHTPLDQQISSSWTWDEVDDPYFEKFAAQGQSYFNASGDSGNYQANAASYGVDLYPVDSPYVAAVGETDLFLNANGTWNSEAACSSSGGGVSPHGVGIPPWQSVGGVISAANQGSTTLRNSPDVSANGCVGVYICSSTGTNGSQVCSGWGGTSAASPLWAGYVALVNQQASSSSQASIGLPNPIVYNLGTTAGTYSIAFHDMTSGNNGLPATTGYDLVSGWGSPNGTGLLTALLATPPITPTISTVAGNGVQGFSGDGGGATSANLNDPAGVSADAAGNLYISDYGNQRVRKAATSGIISTVAGTGVAGYSGDGAHATSYELNDPEGIAADSAGDVYIADYANQRVRKVTAAGAISTIAGTGTAGYNSDGILATGAYLNQPIDVAVDGAGNVYIADSSNQRIRKIATSGIISTVAGTGTSGFSGDGGLATAAKIYLPEGIALDSSGNLYIADTYNNRIRVVGTNGVIKTIAGNGTSGYGGDGGAATSAMLDLPTGVAVDPAGNVFVADSANQRVREINSSGVISTVAGTGAAGYNSDGIPATEADVYYPHQVAIDAAGDVLIADDYNQRIRKLTSAAAPALSLHPTSSTIQSGQSATLSATPTGTSPYTYTYQWYQGTSGNTSTPLSGATGSSFTTAALTSTTSFWVLVKYAYGSENSQTLTVTVSGSGNTTGGSADGPIPLWALSVLGAGLMGIASRRLKRTA